MSKPSQALNTFHTRHVEDEDIRSPRTPTYAPSSMSFFTIPPFDPSRAFAPLSPTISAQRTPPPPKPLAWVWECHLCRSRYPLGATRRCLLDGHFYCSGETDCRNLKKKKRGQSCSSEFDYIGWRSMEQWKRKLRKNGMFIIAREPEGCENCEFPSQCRYANHNPVGKHGGYLGMTNIDLGTSSNSMSATQADGLSRFYKNDNTTFESILASKPKQSKVTDYYNPDKRIEVHASRPTSSAILRERVERAERCSGGQALLSPIQEEFLKGDDDVQDIGDTTEYLMPLLEPWE